MLAAFTVTKTAQVLPPLLGYIGPDVFLPVTSALAAVAGVLLMFWQKIVGLVARMLGRGVKEAAPPPTTKSADERD